MSGVVEAVDSQQGLGAEDLRRVREEVRQTLLDHRDDRGVWRGHLASSALATAVACFALHLAGRARGEDVSDLVEGGLGWLASQANHDGGWGDTVRSLSNLPTTLLARAALHAAGRHGTHRAALHRAEAWIEGRVGSLEPRAIEDHVVGLYGEDRTFSVPILSLCTLAGTLGEGAWARMPALPFELAMLPQGLFRFVGLPVVSYALPALIAIGQVQHHHSPRFPFSLLRQAARRPTLRRLKGLQPAGGGFLEAIPLTAFVTMGRVGSGSPHDPVVDRGVEFLRNSVREDGSWPIDIDLATWVTTLSLQAFSSGEGLPARDLDVLREWLLAQQFREVHPFTGAAPGGWGWTDLPGSVPDADDTPGALLALHSMGASDPEIQQAAERGFRWLRDLQNRDGGLPTFCRGWGRLPFDRSSPDLTAHFLRALAVWWPQLEDSTREQLLPAARKALRYLEMQQREDRSWVPLWFGNEHAEGLENKVYGTARVVRALRDVVASEMPFRNPVAERMMWDGFRYLVSAQNPDGGWGGGSGTPSSIEETALAVEALVDESIGRTGVVRRGVDWLIRAWDAGRWREATPIGFYFANLWYYENLYPLSFLLSALHRVPDDALVLD